MASSSTSSLNAPHPIWTVGSLTEHIISYKSSKKSAGEGSTDVDSLPSTDVDSLPELDSHEIVGAIPNGSLTDPVPASSSQEEISEPLLPLAELGLQEKLRKNLERAMEQQSREPQHVRTLSFSMPGITTQSVRGYEMNAWISSTQARRKYMEDRSIFAPIRFVVGKVTYQANVAGVFDGHGTALVAQFIQRNLHIFLKTTLELYHKDKEAVSDHAIQKGLRSAFKWLHRLSPEQKIYHGSTAIVAFIFNEVIWVANAGDSRAIFCPKNIDDGICVTLSEDASPDNPRFERKIKKRGGEIIVDQNGHLRVNRILTVLSSLGDHLVGCIYYTPIISCYPVKEGFLLMASDGVWHGFSSLDVARLIREIMSKTGEEAFIAQGIVSSALTAGEQDNISVVVIPLLSNPIGYEGTKRARRD